MINYRTFWVMVGLHFFLLEVTVNSGARFTKWMESQIAITAENMEIMLYHFPQIWQNVAYISGFFKIILGFIVIVSVSNDFVYRTGRQNIIDGLSREQFIGSKVLANLLLSALSAVVVFVTVLFLGATYNPTITLMEMLPGSTIIFAYWLEVFGFLSFALFLSVCIPRAGLATLLLITAPIIEAMVAAFLNGARWAIPYLPLKAMSRLVEMSFSEFIFPASPDRSYLPRILVALVWVLLFNYLGYLKFKKTAI